MCCLINCSVEDEEWSGTKEVTDRLQPGHDAGPGGQLPSGQHRCKQSSAADPWQGPRIVDSETYQASLVHRSVHKGF